MPPTSSAIPVAPEERSPHETRVDIGSQAVVTALSSIADAHSADIPLMVRVSLPIFVRLVPNASAGPVLPLDAKHGVIAPTPESLVMLESFMSEWSSLVGDPIVSKWIVIALMVSVFLNGILIKGVASSLISTPAASMVTFASESPEEEEPARLQARWGEVSEKKSSPRSASLTVDIPESKLFPASSSISTVFSQPSASDLASMIGPSPAPVAAPRPVARVAAPTPAPYVSTAARLEAMVRDSPPGTPNGSKASIGRRSLEELLELFAANPSNVKEMSDEEVILLGQQGKIPAYALEKVLGNLERAVFVRRALVCEFGLSDYC